MTTISRKCFHRLLGILTVSLLGLFLVTGVARAYDEWEQVDNPGAGGQNNSTAASAPEEGLSVPAGAHFFACGERARPPDERLKFFVDNIDRLWGTQVTVYESLALRSPHARPGGCVFYNPEYMRALFRQLMIPANNTRLTTSILEAIMAHEIGHEVHNDFSAERADVAGQTKELEADRFAGYTLERLNIAVDSITPYYGLAGDEFTGSQFVPQARHGESSQRIEALKHGWDLARWRLPEDYSAPTEGDRLSDSNFR
jgi:hypothetical protein